MRKLAIIFLLLVLSMNLVTLNVNASDLSSDLENLLIDETKDSGTDSTESAGNTDLNSASDTNTLNAAPDANLATENAGNTDLNVAPDANLTTENVESTDLNAATEENLATEGAEESTDLSANSDDTTVKTLPKTGPEDFYLIFMLSLLLGFFVLKKIKKVA